MERMTFHIAVLGIDGSGKSTVASSLPIILAAEMAARTGSAGEAFRVVAPGEDLLAPGFHPDGLPFFARASKMFRRLAKKCADNRKLYPVFKIPQMLSQDGAAKSLGRRYAADIVVSDGNALLTGSGRASNYRRPASDHATAQRPAPDVEDIKALFSYVVDGAWLPAESRAKLPALGAARLLGFLSRELSIDAIWLPDAVIFLDLDPAIALQRIKSRGQKVDRHENTDDLAQARAMYLKTLEAFARYRGNAGAVHVLAIDGLSPGEVCRLAATRLAAQIQERRASQDAPLRPLGTTGENLSGASFFSKVFTFNYLVRYLTFHFFSGAWREPAFAFSGLGRLFLKEGYSAGTMRVIYDRDEKAHGFFDRVFLEYPLHRAVYDRLQILTRHLEPLLDERLKRGGSLRIFTAPSGFAYDIFRPLEAFKKRSPDALKRVTLVACDLDPHGVLNDELTARAAKLGIRFEFLRGNIMDESVRAQIAVGGPYNLALFVGLSSWLPKPDTAAHLAWLRGLMTPDAALVTDCFTAEAYALSGRYAGYKAHYYTPEIYKVLLDFCGYNGMAAKTESGRDAINHVLVVRLKERI